MRMNFIVAVLNELLSFAHCHNFNGIILEESVVDTRRVAGCLVNYATKSVKRGKRCDWSKESKAITLCCNSSAMNEMLRRIKSHNTMDDGWWLGNNSHYKSQTWTLNTEQGHWIRGSFQLAFQELKNRDTDLSDVRCRSFFLVLPCAMGTYCRCHLHLHNNNTTRLLMAMSATIHAHLESGIRLKPCISMWIFFSFVCSFVVVVDCIP